MKKKWMMAVLATTTCVALMGCKKEEPKQPETVVETTNEAETKKETEKETEKVKKELYKNWYVVDADIQGYFDNINHEILLGLLNRRISDRSSEFSQSTLNILKSKVLRQLLTSSSIRFMSISILWTPLRLPPYAV